MPKVEGFFFFFFFKIGLWEDIPPPTIPETDVRIHAKETRGCKTTKNKFLRETSACKSKQQIISPYSDLCTSSGSRFILKFFALFQFCCLAQPECQENPPQRQDPG